MNLFLATPPRGREYWRPNSALCAVFLTLFILVSCKTPTTHSSSPPLSTLRPLSPSIQPLSSHQRSIRRLAISTNGLRLATIDSQSILLWSLPQMTLITALHGFSALEFNSSIRLSQDGKSLAFIDPNGDLRVWREEWQPPTSKGEDPVTDTADTLPSLKEHTPKDAKSMVGFGPQNELLWVDHQGRLISLTPDGSISILGHTGPLLESSGNSQTGYLLWGKLPTWIHFNTPDQRPSLEPIKPFWGYLSPDLPPLGIYPSKQIVLLKRRELLPLNLNKGRLLKPIPLKAMEKPSHLRLSPNGQRALIASNNKTITWWSAEHWREEGHLRLPNNLVRDVHPKPIYDLVFSSSNDLWILLPDQHLIHFQLSQGTVVGAWSL